MSETKKKRPRIDAGRLAEAIDLPALIERKNIRLVKRGREFTGLCPFHNEATPSFTVYEKNGKWQFKCFGCQEAGDAIGFYMKTEHVSFVEALERLAEANGIVDDIALTEAETSREEWQRDRDEKDRKDRESRTKHALDLWRASRVADGTVVEAYLRSRCIDPDAQGGIPVSLRHHAALKHPDGRSIVPGMVAAVQDVNRDIVAVHRTFLKPDGSGKADVPRAKMMLGPCWGAAVRFDPPGPIMAIAEGIETALTVRQALRRARDVMPVWAALSLGNMGAVLLPKSVEELVLLADADSKDPDKAEAVIRKAADAQRERGLRVRVARPRPGTDFNDMRMAGL